MPIIDLGDTLINTDHVIHVHVYSNRKLHGMIRKIYVKIQYSDEASGDLVDDKAELFLLLVRSIAIRHTDAINPPPVDADGAMP
jgi:hypothetical protein